MDDAGIISAIERFTPRFVKVILTTTTLSYETLIHQRSCSSGKQWGHIGADGQ